MIRLRLTLLVLTACCLLAHVQAQVCSPNVLNVTSGVINQPGGSSVEFSVGEMAIATLNIGGNEVGFTQGFLQPTLGSPFIINTHEAFDDKYSFKCYPNPVSNLLTIETDYKGFTAMQFVNSEGQIIIERIFDYTPIDCTSLPSGVYFIWLFSNSKPESKTLKLFKI